SVNPFTIYPSRSISRLARRFVGAVKIDDQPALRRLTEQRLIQVNDLFRFVIEEVNLRAGHPDALAEVEELFARFRRPQVAAVLPEEQSDFLLSREINRSAHLRLAPTRPEALDDLVLKSQLPGQLRKVLHLFQCVLAAIEVFPARAPWLQPLGLDARRKEFVVGRRRNVVDDVAVDQRV